MSIEINFSWSDQRSAIVMFFVCNTELKAKVKAPDTNSVRGVIVIKFRIKANFTHIGKAYSSQQSKDLWNGIFGLRFNAIVVFPREAFNAERICYCSLALPLADSTVVELLWSCCGWCYHCFHFFPIRRLKFVAMIILHLFLYLPWLKCLAVTQLHRDVGLCVCAFERGRANTHTRTVCLRIMCDIVCLRHYQFIF